MISVTVEFWLWMGKELSEEFLSPSEMRSVLKRSVEDGTTIGELFTQLANRYHPIGDKIFDSEKRVFYQHLVVTMNNRVTSPSDLCERVLKDDDKVTVLPMYMGG